MLLNSFIAEIVFFYSFCISEFNLNSYTICNFSSYFYYNNKSSIFISEFLFIILYFDSKNCFVLNIKKPVGAMLCSVKFGWAELIYSIVHVSLWNWLTEIYKTILFNTAGSLSLKISWNSTLFSKLFHISLTMTH